MAFNFNKGMLVKMGVVGAEVGLLYKMAESMGGNQMMRQLWVGALGAGACLSADFVIGQLEEVVPALKS